MKVEFSNDGFIKILPTDAIDEYALGQWVQKNEVGCDKISIETKMTKPIGFRGKKENNEQTKSS